MAGPLTGRVALVTGASRRQGIGCAVAVRLARQGADLVLAHHRPHDEAQPWGGDDIAEVRRVVEQARLDPAQQVLDRPGDLTGENAPQRLVEDVTGDLGHLDILICNHAQSGRDGALGGLSAEMIDRHYAVNTRSSLLLTQAFMHQHDGRAGGRVVFMTSGQGQGPMPGEVAYAAAKGALAAVTLTLADQLAPRGITVNCVNPGPVDTGYLDGEDRRRVLSMFPFGRWGEPDDPARLIAFLAGDDGRWITGQVIHSEGGFARWRPPAP